MVGIEIPQSYKCGQAQVPHEEDASNVGFEFKRVVFGATLAAIVGVVGVVAATAADDPLIAIFYSI